MRLIDADALREEWLESGENEYAYDTNAVLYSIDSAPTIDAAPVRRGEWVDNEDDVYWHNSFIRKHCSACGGEPHKNRDDAGRIVGYILSHHCPHCGADMRRVSE